MPRILPGVGPWLRYDVAFLDAVSAELNLEGRSAALQRAVRALRESRLESAYAEAIREWDGLAGAADWDTVVADGQR